MGNSAEVVKAPRSTPTMTPFSFWDNKPVCDDAERAYYEKISGAKISQVGEDQALAAKFTSLELENKELRKVTEDLQALVASLSERIFKLESASSSGTALPSNSKEEEDDDDVDLFGSDDEEDEEKARITAERLKAYHEKKSKKPKVIAKTSVLFDVKPWSDETDLDAMKEACLGISMEGLVWGATKQVPLAFGIKKLQ